MNKLIKRKMFSPNFTSFAEVDLHFIFEKIFRKTFFELLLIYSKEYVEPEDKIPWLVEVCVKYINKFGVVSGIYRKPGSIMNVELLRHLFEREKIKVSADELVSYSEIKNDQYCVASFLKAFFRDLKQPLISTSVFQKCEQARVDCRDLGERKDRYIMALQGLSPEHWSTLKFLATHLYELSKAGFP